MKPLFVARLVGAAVAVEAVSCGCGSPAELGSGLPFNDDFSNPTCNWRAGNDRFASLRCADGRYQILIKDPGVPQNVRRFGNAGVGSLLVSANAVQRSGGAVSAYGVSCWSTREKGYLFVVSRRGGWGIFRIDLKANPIQRPLAESPGEHAIPRFGTTNRVRGDCIGGNGKPAILALSVNGKRIAVTRDRGKSSPWTGYGFVAIATKRGLDVGFDNFAARRLSNAEATNIGQGVSGELSVDASTIALASDRDGNSEIYVMNADGSGQTRLTRNRVDDFDPAWSPDKTKLVFDSAPDGNPEIYVMNANGTGQRRLTRNNAEDVFPAWSPDGKKIAFTSDRDGHYEIYVMNADGTRQLRLTRTDAESAYPSWSPDGTKIAFGSARDGNYEIYAMNADGAEQTRLTKNEDEDDFQAWSPDGTTIAFTSSRDGNPEIYVMNADGTRQKDLTRNQAADASPTWSPDGTKIAFTSTRTGNQQIYVMKPDGTDQTNLTHATGGNDFGPAWRPR